MALKKGDFIRVSFTGKLKETGEIFDTTNEEVAKKAGLYEPKLIFRSRPVVIGARHVIPGIDTALESFEIGEEKIIKIAPEDAFGKRDPSKVKLVPLKEFKKQNVNPLPGMRLEFEDGVGRVQSVNGGRVRVDMNHGLAGKALEYTVKVEEKINKNEEKLRQLIELYIPSVDSQEFKIMLKEKKAEVLVPDSLKIDPSAAMGKISAARDIFTFLDFVDEIGFTEVHKRLPIAKKSSKTAKTKPKTSKKKPTSKPS